MSRAGDARPPRDADARPPGDGTERGEPDIAPDGQQRVRSAAQAASRARRIGGAPRPHPRPQPGPGAEPREPAGPGEPAGPAEPPTTAADAHPADAPEALGTEALGKDTLDSEAPASASSASSASPPPSRPGRRAVLRWVPAAVAALVVAALVWGDVYLFDSWRDRRGLSSSAREELLSSVKSSVQLVISYDYRHIDTDEAATAARLTGTFKADYADSMSRVVKPGAIKQQVVVVGQVTTAGVASVDGNQATVLVYAQQTVTNAGRRQPELDPVTVLVTADRVGGEWLIANIERK